MAEETRTEIGNTDTRLCSIVVVHLIGNEEVVLGSIPTTGSADYSAIADLPCVETVPLPYLKKMR